MDTSNLTMKTTRSIFPQIDEHEDKVLPSSSTVPLANNLYCRECNSAFSTISRLKYHKLQKHGKWSAISWTCELCQQMNARKHTKFFSTQSNLNKHLRNVHQTGPLLHTSKEKHNEVSNLTKCEIPTESIAPSCPYCIYSTWDSYNLRVHIRKHTGMIYTFVPICDLIPYYKNIIVLYNDFLCHLSNSFLLYMLGDRPYKCDKCQFRFYKNSDLAKHLKSCNGLIYSCDTCAAAFHFKKQLQHHLIWSQMCGILKGLEGVCSTDSTDSLVSKMKREANEQKRMSHEQKVIDKLSIVRLNVTEKTSIILVN